MAAGEAFTAEQRHRIERTIAAVEQETGVTFSLRVGEVEDDSRVQAERLLANIAGPRQAVVLILVAPTERVLEIMTTPAARRRINDHVAGLAVLSMASSFGVGDIVGGLVTGLRLLADAAGPADAHAVGADASSEALPAQQSGSSRAGTGLLAPPVRQATAPVDSNVIEGAATERPRRRS